MRLSLIVVIYFIILFAFAMRYRGRNKTFIEYVLADRSIGVKLSTLGLLGGFVGGGTLLAVVGHVAEYGLSDIWLFVGAVLSFLLLGVLGRDLRNTQAVSLPDLIEIKFGETASKVILPFVLISICGFIGVQLGAAALIASKTLGVGELYIMAWIVVFVVAYTWIGGMRADTVTDGIQFLVIVIGLLIASYALYFRIEWDNGVIETLKSTGGSGYLDPFDQGYIKSIGLLFVLPLIVITSPTYHQRIYAAKDSTTARQTGIYAAVIYVFISVLILFIGMAGRLTFPSVSSFDNILPLLIETVLRPELAGILLAALLAAVMSSVDSHLITASTIVNKHIFHDTANESSDSTPTRFMVVFFAGFGLVLANISGGLFQLLGATWVLLIATASGPVVYAARNVHVSSRGIIYGIMFGGVGALFLLLIGIKPEYLALPGAIASFAVPQLVTIAERWLKIL